MRVGSRRQALVTLAALALLVTVAVPAVAAASETTNATTNRTATVGPAGGTAAAGAVTTNATATTGPVADAGSATQADTTIDADAVVALTPDDPGTVEVRLSFDPPTQVTSMRVTLPSSATVTGTTEFEETSDGYEWTGDSDPSLTYDLDVNRSNDAEGPLTGQGRYSFVDAGEWALVRQPDFGLAWEWYGREQVGVERSVAPAGEGAAGEVMLYLGPYESHTRRAHGQRFRLVEPAAAEMAADPDAVLATLANASDELRVGDRDETVFGVVAPTNTVGWAARGLQTGDADFWVRDLERLDTPSNVWVHEYVHTRQSFPNDIAESANWLTEGMANYYAALLTLERGDTTFQAFSRELENGGESRYASTVLAEPGTWARHANYEKGALVAGELDRRIRLATGGTNSFENVFAQLNGADGTVDAATLRESIRTVTNDSVTDRLDRYVSTDQTPSMWSRAQHQAAFGPTPPILRTTVPAEGTSYRIAGPYRNRSVGTFPTLVPGETVAIDVSIRNRGGSAGTYELPVRSNDSTVTTLTGTVAGRNATTRTVEYTVAETGQRALTVGDRTFVLSVAEPATPTVTDLRVEPADPTAGEPVVVTATVRNDADRPAETTLAFTRDGDRLAERRVRLDADSTRDVAVETTLEAGSSRLSVGDASTSVTVAAEPTTTETADGDAAGTSGGSGPGFAVGGALLALATLVATLARRRD